MQLMYYDKSIGTFRLGNNEYGPCQYMGSGQCAALIGTSAHVSNAQVRIKRHPHFNNPCSAYRKTRTESYVRLDYTTNQIVSYLSFSYVNTIISSTFFFQQESLQAFDLILQLWAQICTMCLWTYVS
jgi:hypothetical protein